MDKAAAPDLQKQGKGSGFWGCLGCLGVVLVAVVVFGITGANSGGGSRDSAEAIAQCENRIERLLKSPSTARFNSSASGSGTLKVTGTVDSENGFGAMIRSSFGCTVVLNEETNTATTTVDYLN
ncbi:hypothetical protein [Microbacterium sp. 77mftsu3.1]|uniref:hypothetical protein n=1 Tax=Microbacterium sp. 77mftsu3.1 TaxID=1761802 RepID=UPI000884F53E|nr:hypothetical protein [Microbacterium sp. 77mftsu3.1]SDG21058.1 hypothetical protein SAMN04488590_0193 [Microbacterium sp. 77mftsu3.1]